MRALKLLIPTLFFVLACFGLPLSFEQRSAQSFRAPFAEGGVEVRPDRVSFGDVTLRFLGVGRQGGVGGQGQLIGVGGPAPATYLRDGFTRTFRQFPKVAIRNLYPGADAIFYGNGDRVEYDLMLAPSFSADRIRISIEGAFGLTIDNDGAVVARTSSGELRQLRPRAFQRAHAIEAKYVLRGANEIGVELGEYDHESALTIDPVISYSKTFGGAGNSSANVIATDSQGNIYIAGLSNAVDFPTTSGSIQPALAAPLWAISNAGKTITQIHIGTSNSAEVVGATKDGQFLYASTRSGIFISGDGGSTWKKTLPLPVATTQGNTVTTTVNAFAIDAFDPATVKVATTNGVFGSGTGGQSGWGPSNSGLPVSPSGYPSVLNVFFDPANPLIAYAVSNSPSYLFKSLDVGSNWTKLDTTTSSDIAPIAPFYSPSAATLSPDGKTLFAINTSGAVLRSTDAGATFTKIGQVYPAATRILIDPTNPNVWYVQLQNQTVAKSADGGQSFIVLKAPTQTNDIAIDSTGALYALTPANLYVSADGGATFTQVATPINLSGAVLSSGAGKVFVGMDVPGSPFVMKLDPTGSNILYSTFLGGSYADSIFGITVDPQGDAVVVGATGSPSFPFTALPAKPVTLQNAAGFLAKLSPDGSRLLFAIAQSTSKPTQTRAVALDSAGSIYITGATNGADLPTTSNAFQPALPTAACTRTQLGFFVFPNTGLYSFVQKLSGDGKTTAYSTYVTGACGSFSQGIAVDSTGAAIVTGYTTSPDFPVSSGAYQPAFPGDAGSTSPPAILDAGFVSKLSLAGDKLLASTFLGGGYTTGGNALTLDGAGNVYVTGSTQGFATPTTPGAVKPKFTDTCTPTLGIGPSPPYTGTSDAFVLKLDSGLSTAKVFSYFGGGCSDSGTAIAVDPAGNIWLSGSSVSADFVLKGPFQVSYLSPVAGFVSELNPDASQLLFSSFSETQALSLSQGAIYLAGTRGSSALVQKLDPSTTPSVVIDYVSAVAPFPPGLTFPVPPTGVAPGQLIQISGQHMGPAKEVDGQLDSTGRLPFTLAGVTVYFDGIPAPLISVQANLIECFAPFGIASTTQVTVVSDGQRSNPVRTGVVSYAPQIQSVVNQDGTVNSKDHPAKLGSVITLYIAGTGATNPPSTDGLISNAPLPVPVVGVSIFLSGFLSGFPQSGQVTPQYLGAAPGLIAGITQANIVLPVTLAIPPNNVISVGVSSSNAPVYVTP
jgi:uncharacterized protein (TIGR03437 family)